MHAGYLAFVHRLAFADLEARLQAAEAANQQLTATGNASNAAAGGNAGGPLDLIPRPRGKTYSVWKEMGVERAEYKAIQRTVRTLSVRAELDWKEDYRRQDAEKLGLLFKAARKEHPILKRYRDNWATAAIVKQYFQNKRKHAYLQGYIPKKGKEKENAPLADEEDFEEDD